MILLVYIKDLRYTTLHRGAPVRAMTRDTVLRSSLWSEDGLRSIPSRRSIEEIPPVTSCCRSRQTLVIWTCWTDSGSWKCHMQLAQTFCHNRHCSFVTNRACTVLRSPTHPDSISALQAAPSFDAVTISCYPDLRLSFCRTFNLFLSHVQKSNLFHLYFSIFSLAAPLSWSVLLRPKPVHCCVQK